MSQGLRRSAPRSSKEGSRKIGSHIPDRWPYWLAKVEDEAAWKPVTIGGLVKLAQETSVDAVSTALGFAMQDELSLENPMGWLRQAARGIHQQRNPEWSP
jgi:hypothetical protein